MPVGKLIAFILFCLLVLVFLGFAILLPICKCGFSILDSLTHFHRSQSSKPRQGKIAYYTFFYRGLVLILGYQI